MKDRNLLVSFSDSPKMELDPQAAADSWVRRHNLYAKNPLKKYAYSNNKMKSALQ